MGSLDAADPEASTDKRQSGAPSIVLVGISFKTAPIEFRERVASRLSGTEDLGLSRARGILESSVVETCNRMELYLVAEDTAAVSGFVLSSWGCTAETSENFYVKTGLNAISHVFTVASGLDSAVVGEEQILQQVRDAGRRARASGNARSILGPLFDAAYNVGRRVRESFPSRLPKSVSAFALRSALKELGRPPKRVLLIGTGETAKLAALELKGATVYVLTRRKGALTRFPGATRIARRQLRSVASECDLIVAATRSRDYALKREDIRGGRKKVVLDLAFPRNVDPSLRASKSVRLYDLDEIAARARAIPRTGVLAAGERLISQEAKKFNGRLVATRLTPTLANIYRWAETIREEETDLAFRRLGRLSERDRRVVQAMSRRLTSKLMAPHASFVKQHKTDADQRGRLQLLDSIFGGGESS